MSFELERLEDRLVLSPAVPTAPGAPGFPPVAQVTPAESEALIAPLMTRLGPRQEMTPLFPATPAGHQDAPQAPAHALVPEEGLEDELIGDDCDAPVGLLPMIDAPPRPSEATSDEVMSDPMDQGNQGGQEGPADPER